MTERVHTDEEPGKTLGTPWWHNLKEIRVVGVGLVVPLGRQVMLQNAKLVAVTEIGGKTLQVDICAPKLVLQRWRTCPECMGTGLDPRLDVSCQNCQARGSSP